MTITIANETFKTQAALKKRCDEIKSSVAPNAPIVGDAFELLTELLPHHPEFELPAPMSQAEIFVGALPFGKQGFFVSFPNQAPTAVGVKKAIKQAFGKDTSVSSRLLNFKIACRHAIAQQIIAARREFIGHNRERMDGTFVSALSGQEFPMTELAIDHEPPHFFDRLLLTFVKERGVCPLDVSVSSSNGWILLNDDNFADAWREFHQKHAVLRAISTSENYLQKQQSLNEWSAICG